MKKILGTLLTCLIAISFSAPISYADQARPRQRKPTVEKRAVPRPPNRPVPNQHQRQRVEPRRPNYGSFFDFRFGFGYPSYPYYYGPRYYNPGYQYYQYPRVACVPGYWHVSYDIWGRPYSYWISGYCYNY